MIPADIDKAALEAWTSVPTAEWEANAVDIIAKAILEERQRCADVATKEGDGYRDNNLPLCAMGAYQVSKTILSGAA